MPGKGFQLHPENINRKGRPPKDQTLTNLLNKYLHKKIDVCMLDSDGKPLLDDDGKKITKSVRRKQLFIEEIVSLALRGDLAALKYVFDRIDGKPTETIQGLSTNGERLDINVNFVEKKEENE